MNPNRYQIISGIVLITLASVMKAATFPYSINPIIAISLFSGVVISDKKWALTMPIIAMFGSDLMLELFKIAPGFYGYGQIGNYICLMMVTVLGFAMRKINVLNVTFFSIGASILFFLLSNTNCYLFDETGFYGTGISGWINCLIAGIPFVKKGIITDLSFSAIIFGANYYSTKWLMKTQTAEL